MSSVTTPTPAPKGLKAVAVIEILKGSGALILSALFFASLGKDWALATETTLDRFSPSLALPERAALFLENLDRERQSIAAIALLAYAALHLLGGWGLWRARRWAEWLGVFTGGIYIPFEVYEMIHYPSWIALVIMTVNVAVVSYLVYVLRTSE